MATEKTNKEVPTDQVRKSGARAKQQILSRSTMDALLKATPDDLISNDPSAEVIKGNANRSGCWQHAPAQFELFAAADRRLTRVSDWAGMHVKKVERVQCTLLTGTKLLIIHPADADDLSAFPVRRYGNSTAWVNMVSLLAESSLMVDTGWRERFDVAYIPKESALWPGLVIDLSLPKDRRQESKKKGGQAPTQSAEPDTADRTTSEKTKGITG
ncbi:MAG: hypothetical protein JWN15_3982 [Firmicutes bacterium]|nr:hypothetical protein [Bacillota bacterium]